MSILQCDIFWWKLIDRNFFNPIFNTRVVLRASRLFCSFHCFARAYLQTGYSDMLDISYLFNNNILKCIKAKIFPFNQKEMCISIRYLQKLVLLSGVKNTPKIAILRMCYGENGTVKYTILSEQFQNHL